MNNKRWKVLEPVDIPIELRIFVGGHPLISQALVRQGIKTLEQAKGWLYPAHYQPAPANALSGLEEGVELVADAIRSGKQITVWGDFDVDGQTSTTLLVSALQTLGAKVNYYIPVRKFETHGISLAGLEKLIHSGTQLLLTCDTGISEIKAVTAARAQGLQVVITDHHKLPERLPDADAIINPNYLPPSHPLHTLPGVGVAYKFIEGLFDLTDCKKDVNNYLDLVALGVIADLADLKGDTRYLAQKGIAELQSSRRIGLKKLLEKAEINQGNIDEGLIGFQLAPRLNAVGRLDDANIIVEFFMTADESRAEIIAAQIEGLNQHRRMLAREVSQAAINEIERSSELRHDPILVLFNPDWPGGIVGLVASHLVNRYHKPVILLTGKEKIISGSARSIPGLDITEAIRSEGDLLQGYGGHSMAGGLSLPLENLPLFRKRISRVVTETMHLVTEEPLLEITGELTFEELSLDLVDDVNRLAPFGTGNPPLIFSTKNLSVLSEKIVGRNQEHRILTLQDHASNIWKVVWWNGASELLPEGKFDLAYTLSASDFRGERELTLTWVDATAVEAIHIQEKHNQIFDHRTADHPDEALDVILAADPDVIVWAEANQPMNHTVVDRYGLNNSQSLVIWNIPPSARVLREVIDEVKPRKIHLFAVRSTSKTLQELLANLAGMLKFTAAQNTGGLDMNILTIRLGISLELLLACLEFIRAKGWFEISFFEDSKINVETGKKDEKDELPQAAQKLQSAWAEYTAWQQFFISRDKDNLLD